MEYKPLTYFCNINMGQSPDSNTYNNESNGLPFYQGNADFGEIHPNTRVWCSKPIKIANKNDVLISVRAPIGALNIANNECCIGRGLASLTPNIELTTTNYLLYALKSKVNELNQKGTGSTFKAISKKILEETTLPFYSIDQQHKIVAILDQVNHIISLRTQQLEQLDLLIKSHFVEMFGDPVRNEKGWETRKISEVAPINNYKGNFVDDKVWLLNLDMIEPNTGKIIDYVYVDKNEISNSTCSFDTSNVLYSKLRPYLNKVVIPDRIGFGTSELVPLQPITKLLIPIYFANLLRNKEFVYMISQKVAGAKMPRVMMEEFRNFEVPLPPLDLQTQFAAFVEEVERSKSTVKQSLSWLNTLKSKLMQDFFG